MIAVVSRKKSVSTETIMVMIGRGIMSLWVETPNLRLLVIEHAAARVGCLQLNCKSQGDRFKDLKEANQS